MIKCYTKQKSKDLQWAIKLRAKVYNRLWFNECCKFNKMFITIKKKKENTISTCVCDGFLFTCLQMPVNSDH